MSGLPRTNNSNSRATFRKGGDQQTARFRYTNANESQLADRVDWIGDRDLKWISEYCYHLCKADAVLGQVQGCLVGIPFELH